MEDVAQLVGNRVGVADPPSASGPITTDAIQPRGRVRGLVARLWAPFLA